MTYKIELRPEALEDLKSIDSIVVDRVLKKLEWLKDNFEIITPKSLKGEFKGLFKLRVGDYRVLYTYDKKQKLISVHLVGHRRDIYKG